MRFPLFQCLLLVYIVLGSVIPERAVSDTLGSPIEVLSDATNDHQLDKRVWTTKTVTELVKEMRKTGALQKNSAIFYNGFASLPAGYNAAKRVAQELGKTILYDKAVPDAYYRAWASPGRETPEQQDIRIKAMSAAFAYAATGTVYVLTPKGSTFRNPSVWADYEETNLTRSPYVHEIIRIDYEEGKPVSQMKKTTIWKGPKGPAKGIWPPRVDAKYKAIFDIKL